MVFAVWRDAAGTHKQTFDSWAELYKTAFQAGHQVIYIEEVKKQ